MQFKTPSNALFPSITWFYSDPEASNTGYFNTFPNSIPNDPEIPFLSVKILIHTQKNLQDSIDGINNIWKTCTWPLTIELTDWFSHDRIVDNSENK